jgi:hypothetical protein
MPLSTTNVGFNIREQKNANQGRKKKRSKAQIIAIALDAAEKSKNNKK